jgi:hypothetical protein
MPGLHHSRPLPGGLGVELTGSTLNGASAMDLLGPRLWLPFARHLVLGRGGLRR